MVFSDQISRIWGRAYKTPLMPKNMEAKSNCHYFCTAKWAKKTASSPDWQQEVHALGGGRRTVEEIWENVLNLQFTVYFARDPSHYVTGPSMWLVDDFNFFYTDLRKHIFKMTMITHSHTSHVWHKQRSQVKSNGSRPKQLKDNFGNFKDYERRSAPKISASAKS